MKTKLKYAVVCAFIIAISACSNRIPRNSSSTLKSEKTLFDLMKDKFQGFNVGLWPSGNPPKAGLVGGDAGKSSVGFAKKMSYKIFDKELHLIIDGVDIEQYYVPDNPDISTGEYIKDRNKALIKDRMQFIERYLVSIKAEDVKDIELISGPEYNSKYKSTSSYNNKLDQSLSFATTDFVYVAVTTKSGTGALLK